MASQPCISDEAMHGCSLKSWEVQKLMWYCQILWKCKKEIRITTASFCERIYAVFFRSTSHSWVLHLTRLTAKDHNADIFAAYNHVRSEKQHCWPAEISYAETEASVPLADLLQHTNDRILVLRSMLYVVQNWLGWGNWSGNIQATKEFFSLRI